MNFIKLPNLPESRVNLLIIGQKYAELLQSSLQLLNVDVLELPDNPNVDPRLSGHADLSVLHVGTNRLILADYLKKSEFSEKLACLGEKVLYYEEKQDVNYPLDAGLNVCFVGSKLICNPATASGQIVNHLTNNNTIIRCRQGYSRCSVCVVDGNSIITADTGIADAAEYAGLSVLKVKPGLANLVGFSDGFIGGAAFKLSSGELAFTGTIADSLERNRIEEFIRRRGVEPVYLTDIDLFDIGGAVTITEA